MIDFLLLLVSCSIPFTTVIAAIFHAIARKQNRAAINDRDSPFWWSFFGGLLFLFACCLGLPYLAIWLFGKLFDPSLMIEPDKVIGELTGGMLVAVGSLVTGIAVAMLGSILGGIYGLRRFRRSRRR